MLGRALNLAAATLIGCLLTTAVQAQNLDAGKSPAQIFGSTCTACHKTARGLLKTVSPSSLPGFLRQHYTTGTDMAQTLSGYLMSNGATAAESRSGGKRGKPDAGGNLRSDAPIGSAAPDADRSREQAQRPERRPRPARPDVATQPDGTPVAGAPGEPTGLKGKQRLTKKNRKGEPPKAEPAAAEPNPDVAAKPDAKPDAASAPAMSHTIDAGVPVPEPVDLPPPTAADIKPEPVKKPEPAAAEAPRTSPEKPVTDKADAEKKSDPDKGAPDKAASEAPKPAAAAPAATPSSPSASANGGSPAPPISR